jgi:methylmalonyl-CoA mutase C-terminal domain/subunit
MALLRERGMDDVLVLVGGIVPDVDVAVLKDMGVRGVFLPGSSMQEIVAFIRTHVRAAPTVVES